MALFCQEGKAFYSKLHVLTALLLLAASMALLSVRAAFAPNHFIGTCLTEEWVASMEAQLGVSASERDKLHRLVHPFLRSASKHPRYQVNDPRTARSDIFTPECMGSNPEMFGVGAQVNANGKVISQGKINRTLVVEVHPWTSHMITSNVFSILAGEVYGYEVSMFVISESSDLTQRMSSVHSGLCSPVHANFEVWIAGIEAKLDRYANESVAVGGIGYFGRAGLYTSTDFVKDTLDTTKYPAGPHFANFWKGYQISEELIEAVPVSRFTSNSAFYPPKDNGCADGVRGCLNQCSKAAACTDRERAGKECLVVIMMYDSYDPGYLQAAMANNGIPAYFCFIGYDGAIEYVLYAQENSIPVLFYHFEPDLFHISYAGLFERVFLPRSVPERVVLATSGFGENGYGEITTNPVDVDFPNTKLTKYAASLLYDVNQEGPAGSLISKISLTELHINDMLRKQTTFPKRSDEPTPEFQAACKWLHENYSVWKQWLDRLPICTFDDHIEYQVSGCESNTDISEVSGGQTSIPTRYRTITFAWRRPDPSNISLPYTCDGGLTEFPPPLKTSRSCKWILADSSKWVGWITSKPACDATFYAYQVSNCDANSKRTVRYYWLLPDPADRTKSLECDVSAMPLPADVSVECEYLPFSTPLFKGIATVAGVLIGIFLCAILFVFVNRAVPIVKRSQFELLLLMISGGILVCLSALVYAGEPSEFLCAFRPILISTGFTTIFGALFVKSLRVYRVFMKSAMKRVTITMGMMIKVLSVFYAVDCLIIGVWFGADFPKPTTTYEPAREFHGTITRITCKSESFIFSALLMFWKAIVLFLGIYTSFLIRNVSADFQESIWIFSSSVMVLVGCLVILPLAYLVELAAKPFYAFLASALLFCTAIVMAFMLVPKILRLHAESTSASSSKYSVAGSTLATGTRDSSVGGDTASRVTSSSNLAKSRPGDANSDTAVAKMTARPQRSNPAVHPTVPKEQERK